MNNEASKVLVINGSYRDDGVIDRIVASAIGELRQAGSEIDQVRLRDEHVGFCLNCRECTQLPGEIPGKCVQQDGMQMLVDRIERADAYILASPTNFGSATAVFKRFMERLVVYTYWPWQNKYPRLRKADAPKKKALLISSSAAPGFLGRWMFSTGKQLKMTATTIGAEPVGSVYTGAITNDLEHPIPARVESKTRALVGKLLAR